MPLCAISRMVRGYRGAIDAVVAEIVSFFTRLSTPYADAVWLSQDKGCCSCVSGSITSSASSSIEALIRGRRSVSSIGTAEGIELKICSN